MLYLKMLCFEAKLTAFTWKVHVISCHQSGGNPERVNHQYHKLIPSSVWIFKPFSFCFWGKSHSFEGQTSLLFLCPPHPDIT